MFGRIGGFLFGAFSGVVLLSGLFALWMAVERERAFRVPASGASDTGVETGAAGGVGASIRWRQAPGPGGGQAN